MPENQRRAIWVTGPPASVTTRILNVSLHGLRKVLDPDAMRFLPPHIQEDIVGMFAWLRKAVQAGGIR